MKKRLFITVMIALIGLLGIYFILFNVHDPRIRLILLIGISSIIGAFGIWTANNK